MSAKELMEKREQAYTEYLYCEASQLYAAALYYRGEYTRLSKILNTYGQNEEL